MFTQYFRVHCAHLFPFSKILNVFVSFNTFNFLEYTSVNFLSLKQIFLAILHNSIFKIIVLECFCFSAYFDVLCALIFWKVCKRVHVDILDRAMLLVCSLCCGFYFIRYYFTGCTTHSVIINPVIFEIKAVVNRG